MEELGSRWRKASYSDNGGNCVEVADATRVILVRDTTNRDGVTLSVPASAWRHLVSEVRSGRIA
jgi:hypothetical protein